MSTMIGSGIYSEDWEGEFDCPSCGVVQEGTFDRNDYGAEHWTCSVCRQSFRLPLDDDRGRP